MQYYPNNGVLLKHKKEWNGDTGYNMDGSEDAMPNERCLSEETTYYRTPVTGNVPNSTETQNRLVAA